MSFESDMAAATDDILGHLNEVRCAAIHTLCSRIIDDTPVLNGDLKGSWHTSIGAPNTTFEPVRDPTGVVPKEENKQNLGGLTDTVYFSNGAPYSEVIEFDGHSAKAPEGMVRKNLASFPNIMAELSSSRSP